MLILSCFVIAVFTLKSITFEILLYLLLLTVVNVSTHLLNFSACSNTDSHLKNTQLILMENILKKKKQSRINKIIHECTIIRNIRYKQKGKYFQPHYSFISFWNSKMIENSLLNPFYFEQMHLDLWIIYLIKQNFSSLQIDLIFKNIEMGQTCNGIDQYQGELPKINANTFSTAVPMDESFVKIDLSHSQLLQSRTSNIKRRNDSLNQSIRMRLSQLPDLSRFKKTNYDDDKRIYIDTLKAYYCGQFDRDKPNGFGSLQFDNGDYLEGEFNNGRCQGQGRYIKSNGSYYEGDFKNNVADGYGKYFDKTGFKYQGQWKNNMPNGRGEAVYPDQSRYNGDFINNKRHGKGILMQKKSIFQGEFVQNKLEGTATMQNQNGEKYEGQWKQNEKHGEGQYTWPNGNKYKGSYKFGKRQGFGVMTYSNGQIYQGYWIEGLKQGQGSYKSSKGTIKGVWRKGELVQQKR